MGVVLMSEWEAREEVGHAAVLLVAELRDRPKASVAALLGGRRSRVRLTRREARCLWQFRHAVATARAAGWDWVVDEQVAGAREMLLASVG